MKPILRDLECEVYKDLYEAMVRGGFPYWEFHCDYVVEQAIACSDAMRAYLCNIGEVYNNEVDGMLNMLEDREEEVKWNTATAENEGESDVVGIWRQRRERYGDARMRYRRWWNGLIWFDLKYNDTKEGRVVSAVMEEKLMREMGEEVKASVEGVLKMFVGVGDEKNARILELERQIAELSEQKTKAEAEETIPYFVPEKHPYRLDKEILQAVRVAAKQSAAALIRKLVEFNAAGSFDWGSDTRKEVYERFKEALNLTYTYDNFNKAWNNYKRKKK